jgi:[acyl-carrier-protein] S-malonyltransferase
MRIAFVHPGQGALRSGMAAAWRGHPAGQVIDEVGERAGLDLWTLADDPASGADTAVAQPAILAVSLAASRALTDAGIRPAFVAGHSLGECTAAIVGGALSVADGAEVVAERGRAMGAACRANPGTMAAIIKLDRDEVDRLVARVPDAQVANDNAPGQVVVSGPVDAIDQVAELARDEGGRAMALDVEGAFHSAAMTPATVALDGLLRRTGLDDLDVPLVTGTTGELVASRGDVHRALVDGILAPVRWVDVQRKLAALEVDLLVECGPGGVLKGMAKRTVPDLDVLTVSAPEDVDDVVAHVLGAAEALLIPDPVAAGGSR